jgi:hypothetical protein
VRRLTLMMHLILQQQGPGLLKKPILIFIQFIYVESKYRGFLHKLCTLQTLSYLQIFVTRILVDRDNPKVG